MRQGTKPLIFVEPLSQTLQKLREVISETAESEGIEVFEVENLAELGQLVPTIGQSLVLTSSPKKCALFLQANRVNVKKIGTKTILLSPKAIPRKTLDKFMKVGLTECVIEPVNPKTLLYKVRLQLRSIVVKEEEDENQTTSFKRNEGDTNENANTQMRTEKGVIFDEDGSTETKKRERKDTEEIIMEDPRKANRKSYQEEAIDGYYKGKQRKEEVEFNEDGTPKKKGYQEEAIEAHYKGKTAVNEIEIEDDIKKKKKSPMMMEEFDDGKRPIKSELDLEEDLLSHAKDEIANLMNEDIDKRKKALVLDVVDEEAKTKEKTDAEDLGGHYKGKLNQNKLDLEEEDYLDEKEKDEAVSEETKKKKKPKLELLEDEKDYLDEKEEDELDSSAEKKIKKAKLEILDDGEKDHIDKPEEDLYQEEREKKAKLQVLDDSKDKKTREKEQLEIEEKEKQKKDAKADKIDSYLRGGAAKKDIEIEEDDIYKDEKLDAKNAEKKRKKEALLLEEDDIEKDSLLDEKEYDDDFNKKKKAEKLLLDDDDSFGKREKMLAKGDDGFGKRKSSYKEDDKGGFSKTKGSAKKEQERGMGNRADARADVIKTHYSSKESLKHGNQDWDTKWEKKEKEEDFGPQRREDKEISIAKQDLGEQTIDYAQLKKEFEGISIDGVANKKKQYGIIDNVIKPKTYKKKVATPEGELEEMEFEEVEEENMEVEGEQVFEPESLGMEIAIEVQDFYFEKDVDTHKLCRFLDEKMRQAFKGDLVFYSFANEEMPPPFFNGLVEGKVGEEPAKLPEEELEGYSRLERKELENDYKEELAAYKKDLKEAQEDWSSLYGNLLEEWKTYKTPSWKDHTFQVEANHFVFPFYEGVTLMGLAVFVPEEGFNPERSDALEAVFEVARGIFITEYHKSKGEGQIRQKKAEKPKEEKKGLFGKLFGKAG